MHLQRHVQFLVTLLLSAPRIAYSSPKENIELSEIKATPSGVVRIDYCSSKDESYTKPNPLHYFENLKLFLVIFIVIIEAPILFVPLDIFSHHLSKQILIIFIYSARLAFVCFSENTA